MLTNKKITVLLFLFFAVIFLLPEVASAQDVYGVNDLSNTNLGTRDLRDMVAGIINIFLGFLGILATVIILYGGYIWMTSGGNADKIDRAKKIIINGVIGLAIILSSYAIARFLLQEGYDGTVGGSGGSGGGYTGGLGLGGGVIESHYPSRNAREIPRNTNIFVTFKEPIDATDIVVGTTCTTIVGTLVECQADTSHIILAPHDGVSLINSELIVTYDTAELLNFQFDPAPLLGDDVGDVPYKMTLDDLATVAGATAFPFTGYYDWDFTVNNEVDITPPRVDTVLPVGLDNPRNSVVQINFTEPVNPIVSAGVHPPFTNITVDEGGVTLDGQYWISNQYQTVEFITDVWCGSNSCGGDVYCLPASATMLSTVSGTGAFPNVITDMAGNILDGDGDGGAGGDFTWTFSTNNTIDLDPPEINNMEDNDDASVSEPIRVTFDENLLSSSINSTNIQFHQSTLGDVNFWLGLNSSHIVEIRHDILDPSTDYTPTLTSGISDLRQNCWYFCECTDPTGTCLCDNNNAAVGTDCPWPNSGTNCGTSN
ncbi:hypothetical protein HON36_04070 [Candidatus Parcubacteria bacterium]|jgi:hypothetical protein|nr:hypothetical protein [Candidatus Parcubacteria bacterium]